jgi:DNA-binding CsgD family transcriptional regulator
VHETLAQARRGLGDVDGAAADRATALAAYRRLGARPDAERLAGTSRPGGLTAREEEVLAWIATGTSNREVAQRLVISEKTVSRHLANIFTKIGVGSRTAAAAWAHDHGLH